MEIHWSHTPDESGPFADFFIQHVSTDYISHVELQVGRATSATQWSPRLREILIQEFLSENGRKAFFAYEGEEIVAVGFVLFHPQAPSSYAVLEDFVLHSHWRGQMLGTRVLAWVEAEAKRSGVTRLYLETGSQNPRAQAFFFRNGFEPASVIMAKTL